MAVYIPAGNERRNRQESAADEATNNRITAGPPASITPHIEFANAKEALPVAKDHCAVTLAVECREATFATADGRP